MNTMTFVTSAPKPIPNITLIIDPFDNIIWICIVVVFILMSCNVFLISQQWEKLKKLSMNWAIISSSVRQQLYFYLPSIGSLRILFSGWLLACFVLTSSYSGCLHSLMAFPSKIKTINTIEELANAQRNREIQVIVTENFMYFHLLKVISIVKCQNSSKSN
jgi:hypothetical protein